ncbi:MAG: SGNH/GDSL hydrolase family protein [Bacteroidetes bacterium]|nr:SGNH/GDSL hydrolase family protein [Bacteroidota bacterium]
MNKLISCRSFIEYNESIGHLYIPDLFVRIMHENGGYFLKTNNRGFRSDTDFKIQKGDKIKRVMVFGDSFTAGDGVENSQRYSDLLQANIRDIEVLNFGLSHSGTDQQYLIFKEIAKEMKPDLIIISPLLENIRRNMKSELLNQTQDGQFFFRSKPYFEIQESELKLCNIPVPKTKLFNSETIPAEEHSKLRIVLSSIKKFFYKNLKIKANIFPEYDSENRIEWRVMKAILTKWVNELDCPVILMPIPWYLQFEHPDKYVTENYIQRFNSLKFNRECDMINLLEEFQKYDLDMRRSFTYKYDKHFSPAGHIAVAESLIPIVKSSLKK